jgi:hypothetical protein
MKMKAAQRHRLPGLNWLIIQRQITALVSDDLPIVVPGNSIDTLRFNITAANSLTDTSFIVDARVSGFDINSGISIGDTVQSMLVSQSPADITYIAGTIDPAVFEPDTNMLILIQCKQG